MRYTRRWTGKSVAYVRLSGGLDHHSLSHLGRESETTNGRRGNLLTHLRSDKAHAWTGMVLGVAGERSRGDILVG